MNESGLGESQPRSACATTNIIVNIFLESLRRVEKLYIPVYSSMLLPSNNAVRERGQVVQVVQVVQMVQYGEEAICRENPPSEKKYCLCLCATAISAPKAKFSILAQIDQTRHEMHRQMLHINSFIRLNRHFSHHLFV